MLCLVGVIDQTGVGLLFTSPQDRTLSNLYIVKLKAVRGHLMSKLQNPSRLDN